MDEYQLQQRERYIRNIGEATPLEAVFLLLDYNARRRGWGAPFGAPSSDIPELALPEVLPAMSQATYESFLPAIRRLWKDGQAVALAYYRYPEATRSYEEELDAFRTNNPGFSEEAYQTVIHKYLVELR